MKPYDLNFRGLSAPVLTVGIDDPGLLLSGFFNNWPFDVVPPGDAKPFATLVFNGEQYFLKTNKSPEPVAHNTLVNAVCDLIAAAGRQRADEQPQEMCLHAAAVRIGKALVVFPAVRRAGKSSLTMALAAKGFQVFGDDVLPVASQTGAPPFGRAMGAPIRLRVPLPKGLPGWLLDHINAYRGPSNQQYVYVSPPEMASNGQEIPIGAFVNLVREDDCATEFSSMSPGILLRSLLKQNFARSATADLILADLFGLAENTPSFTLRYSNIEQAVDVLVEHLEGQDAPLYQARKREVQRPSKIEAISNNPEIALSQSSSAVLRELGGQAFATSQDLTRVLHLNEGAVRIWTLLSKPTSEADAAEILRTAFPNVPFNELKSDTQKTFRDLRHAGLVKVAGIQVIHPI
jgi:hypothetical protein